MFKRVAHLPSNHMPALRMDRFQILKACKFGNGRRGRKAGTFRHNCRGRRSAEPMACLKVVKVGTPASFVR